MADNVARQDDRHRGELQRNSSRSRRAHDFLRRIREFLIAGRIHATLRDPVRQSSDSASGFSLESAVAVLRCPSVSVTHGMWSGSVETSHIMGEPFQLTYGQQPRSFGLLGEGAQLKLDPKIQAELDAMQYRLEFDRLRSQWYAPDWSQINSLWNPHLVPPTGSAPPPNYFASPPAQGAGTCGWSAPSTNTEPMESRAGEASDVLKALWALPAVKCAVTDVSDQFKQDWNRLGTGQKTLVISGAVVIAGGTLAGILSGSSTRTMFLEKISGVDIPVPKAGGLSFKIIAPQGIFSGAGLGYDNDVLKIGASFERSKLPDNSPYNDGSRFNNVTFGVQLDVLKAIPFLTGKK